MKYIEQITISKFRSFGIKEQLKCTDLNIFSGGNDSGKSNILKALNLFFNEQSDFSSSYNSDKDFNKWFRDNNERGERNIVIEVQFKKGNFHDKEGINKGFIGEKIFYSNGAIETEFYDINRKKITNKASLKRANAIIKEKIQYLYIPAIRDTNFRAVIQRKIQSIAEANDNRSDSSPLKMALQNVEKGINDELQALNSYVLTEMGIMVDPNVNFSTLLESLTFDTSEKIKIVKRNGSGLEVQKVALNSRGEGIQMQFFSFLLWYIAKKDKKHFYIWGYEEPEIAFELKRQFEILELYKKEFSKVAQIFVTSHSPAFAFSESDGSLNVFRVSYESDPKKDTRFLSRIRGIDDYYNDLFTKLETAKDENKTHLERDIWGVNIQKLSEALGNSLNQVVGLRHINNEELKAYLDQLKQLATEKSQVELELKATEEYLKGTFPNNVFICEDENCVTLWETLLNKVPDMPPLKVYTSTGCTNDKIEIVFTHKIKERQGYSPKIFRQLDRDGLTDEQIQSIELAKSNKYKKFKKYKVKFLPVYEIENFAVLMENHFTDEIFNDSDRLDKITDAFYATAISIQRAAIKYFDDETTKEKFNTKEAKMIRDARQNRLKYFPGKEIAKFKKNFVPERVLKDADLNSLPAEFRKFLDDVKDFFRDL